MGSTVHKDRITMSIKTTAIPYRIMCFLEKNSTEHKSFR